MWKIKYLNSGERYEFMIDHRSYTQNLKPEIQAWIFFQAQISQLLKLCV